MPFQYYVGKTSYGVNGTTAILQHQVFLDGAIFEIF